MAEQISRENWEQSHDKWAEIVIKTRKKEKFFGDGGFRNLSVSRKCGYCYEFHSQETSGCPGCPLYQKKYAPAKD
jgi:hypothetical protein